MPKPTPTYTPELIAGLRRLVADCPTWAAARARIVTQLGTHPDNVTRMNRRHGFWGAAVGAAASGDAAQSGGAVTGTSEGGDGFCADVELSKAATLDEVIQLCEVDTTVWESKGFNVRRGAKGFAWSARFAKRKGVVDVTAMTETFMRAAAEHAPRVWATPTPRSKGADCLYVLNLQDQHLGKLAASKETGHPDWDIKIAERTYREAITELMHKAPSARIDEVVVICGSDMLQVDTDMSTTSKGTYVDSDSRLSKVFDTAAKMLTDVIEEIASRFKVRVVVVAGNHDSSCSHFLGRYVEAWFRSHPNVRVDASPCSRKYVGYGKTLIAFDHGDETKPKDLPLIVMRENQSTISQYRFIEALVGHTHHEQSDDIKGIVVRVAPALCSPDKWHARAGYIGNVRRSQGLLYQRDNGLEAIYYSCALD